MNNYAARAYGMLAIGFCFAGAAYAGQASVAGLGVPLSNAHLQDFRGGFDSVKNDLQLSGAVADNLARNVVTGNNTIASGSFANSTGFPIVIQNSGANVLIQNATIINLQY